MAPSPFRLMPSHFPPPPHPIQPTHPNNNKNTRRRLHLPRAGHFSHVRRPRPPLRRRQRRHALSNWGRRGHNGVCDGACLGLCVSLYPPAHEWPTPLTDSPPMPRPLTTHISKTIRPKQHQQQQPPPPLGRRHHLLPPLRNPACRHLGRPGRLHPLPPRPAQERRRRRRGKVSEGRMGLMEGESSGGCGCEGWGSCVCRWMGSGWVGGWFRLVYICAVGLQE